jgi:hypothetical protein
VTCDTCGIAVTSGTRCDECKKLADDLKKTTDTTENR